MLPCMSLTGVMASPGLQWWVNVTHAVYHLTCPADSPGWMSGSTWLCGTKSGSCNTFAALLHASVASPPAPVPVGHRRAAAASGHCSWGPSFCTGHMRRTHGASCSQQADKRTASKRCRPFYCLQRPLLKAAQRCTDRFACPWQRGPRGRPRRQRGSVTAWQQGPSVCMGAALPAGQVTLKRSAGMGSFRSGATQRSAPAKEPQRAGSQLWLARGPTCQEATFRQSPDSCLARKGTGHATWPEQAPKQAERRELREPGQCGAGGAWLLIAPSHCRRASGRYRAGCTEHCSPAQLLEAVGKAACGEKCRNKSVGAAAQPTHREKHACALLPPSSIKVPRILLGMPAHAGTAAAAAAAHHRSQAGRGTEQRVQGLKSRGCRRLPPRHS